MKAQRKSLKPVRPKVSGVSFRLYVTGASPRSTRAIRNLRSFCERHLLGNYRMEVIDIYQQPEQAAVGQVVAAPTLVKQFPLPLRRFVGDLSDATRLLAALNLPHP